MCHSDSASDSDSEEYLMEGSKANIKMYYIIEIIVLFCKSDDYFMDENHHKCQEV